MAGPAAAGGGSMVPADKLFEMEHYLGRDVSQLDTIFLVSHVIMTAVHKRLLVTRREMWVFDTAVAVFACTLLLKVMHRPVYNRHRTPIAFICHICLTSLRAAAVYTMASKQAIHFRRGLVASPDSTAIFLATMLSVLGGPFRLFEMLGLQMPLRLHVANTALYVALHGLAVLEGVRLAYSNAMFLLTHRVHDMVQAVADSLLEALAGLPAGHQATCSSCAGPVIYLFLFTYGSVVAPLYLTALVERAARKRFRRRMATAAAQAAAEAPAAAQAGGGQRAGAAAPAAAAAAPGAVRVEGFEGASGLAMFAVHVIVLCAMLVACWVLSSAFAHILLPRVLSSQQLALWCPNRPRAPFVIAGEVYESEH